jgi:hypothetical protein
VHVAALRPRVAARTVDKTGLDALRRDLAVSSPADRPAIAASLGRIERDLAPPRYRQKLTNRQEFLNVD